MGQGISGDTLAWAILAGVLHGYIIIAIIALFQWRSTDIASGVRAQAIFLIHIAVATTALLALFWYVPEYAHQKKHFIDDGAYLVQGRLFLPIIIAYLVRGLHRDERQSTG